MEREAESGERQAGNGLYAETRLLCSTSTGPGRRKPACNVTNRARDEGAIEMRTDSSPHELTNAVGRVRGTLGSPVYDIA